MRIPTLLAAAALLGACDDTVTGNQPVGGDEASEAAIERFVRRAHLDLSGTPPSAADLAARVATVRAAGNTPAARRALVQELMAAPAYATVWTEELENRVLGGETLAYRYQFVCSIIRDNDPVCGACTAGGDPCECACAPLTALKAERTSLMATATDLRGGARSSVIERRFAMARGYYLLSGAPENRATALFQDFLGRPAEPEERENARAMIVGGLGAGPAGLLFHRHGRNYTELVDIVFDSEIYREAMVALVFDRYLARAPSSAERAHFVSVLDAGEPDVRPVIEAVLTSREYFDP